MDEEKTTNEDEHQQLTPGGYLRTDHNGIIQAANAMAAQILEVDQESLVGTPLSTFIGDDNLSNFQEQTFDEAGTPVPPAWQARITRGTDNQLDIALTMLHRSDLAPGETYLHWLLRDLRDDERTLVREQTFHAMYDHVPIGIAYVGAADGAWLHANLWLSNLLGYSAAVLKTLVLRDITPSDDLDTTLEFYQQVQADTAQKGSHEKRYLHADGSTIWASIAALPGTSSYDGVPYLVISVGDITERKEQEARELEQKMAREALLRTALALTSSLDMPDVIEHILLNGAEIVPHDAMTLILLQEGTTTIARSYGYGTNGLPEIPGPTRTIPVPARDNYMLTLLLEHGSAYLIPDWVDHKPVDQPKVDDLIRSSLGVPILTRGRIIGALHLHSMAAGHFTEQHRRQLEAFAVQAATAIENAHAYEEAQAIAITTERQRVARDLHDAVSQTLFSANLIADSLPRMWSRVPGKISEQLEQLKALTRGAQAEMRVILLELRPDYLTSTDFSTQLQHLVDAFTTRYDLLATLSIRDERPLPSHARVAFYRIAQEAFNNVAKHAHATQLTVRYQALVDRVDLDIRDNGIGYPPARSGSGFGLRNMTERAEAIGAQLEMSSKTGVGTRIHLQWQFQERQEEHDTNEDHSSDDC